MSYSIIYFTDNNSRGEATVVEMPPVVTAEMQQIALAYGQLVGEKALLYLKDKDEREGPQKGVMYQVRACLNDLTNPPLRKRLSVINWNSLSQ